MYFTTIKSKQSSGLGEPVKYLINVGQSEFQLYKFLLGLINVLNQRTNINNQRSNIQNRRNHIYNQ